MVERTAFDCFLDHTKIHEHRLLRRGVLFVPTFLVASTVVVVVGRTDIVGDWGLKDNIGSYKHKSKPIP